MLRSFLECMLWINLKSNNNENKKIVRINLKLLNNDFCQKSQNPASFYVQHNI